MDVKWIKLSTGIFDNDKIKQIEVLPDGDSLIVIWLKLLVLAGEKNDGGAIYFTKSIPYTEQMLSVAFRRPLSTVQLALATFQNFGMIEIVNDFISLPNWEKYQSAEGLDRIREQTKKRVADYRSRQKALAQGNTEESVTCNATRNVTVTQSNATDIDIEEDTDREKDIDITLSERKKDKRKKADAEPELAASDETSIADQDVISVFRSFLEREYKALSPEQRMAAREWSQVMMKTMEAYVRKHRERGDPLTEKAAEGICSMLKGMFPPADWLGFFQVYIGEEDA